MKLNNKGFTLVEVLAVIVILGILAAIMIPATTRFIEGNKEDNYVNLQKSIKSAAKIFITDNKYDITLDPNVVCSDSNTERIISGVSDTSVSDSKITLHMLVTNGVLTAKRVNDKDIIINPKNDKDIDLNASYIVVKYDCNTRDYKYGNVVVVDID